MRVNQVIDKPIKIQADTFIINKVVNVLYSLLYLQLADSESQEFEIKLK